MPNTAVIGLQWGDESKGKLVDVLSENHDVVIRSQGGGNAGHTVVVENQTYKLHMIPSGIIRKKLCIIGNGVVIHSGILKEIEDLQSKGIEVSPENLVISERAHVTLKYHKMLDGVIGGKIGTTKRGIGPTYADKAYRTGIRFCDFLNLDDDDLETKVIENTRQTNHFLEYFIEKENFVDVQEVLEESSKMKEKLTPFIRRDIFKIIQEHDGTLLFENAQGTLLGIDEGTYPNCTSSNTTRGGIYTGVGGYVNIPNIIGVLKAYTTRVGEGFFPTELNNEIGNRIRKNGKEVGTTTGRDRRCGWLDLFAADYSCKVNGVTEIFLPKLDVLDQEPIIRMSIGYLLKRERIDNFECVLTRLEKCKPFYEEIEGWQSDTTGIRKLKDLPKNARDYIDRIQEYLKIPIKRIGVGPKRDQIIEL